MTAIAINIQNVASYPVASWMADLTKSGDCGTVLLSETKSKVILNAWQSNVCTFLRNWLICRMKAKTNQMTVNLIIHLLLIPARHSM